jgi:hypothetical protein
VEALLERYRVYVDDVRGPDVLVPLEQLTDLTVAENLLEAEDLLERLEPFASIEEPHLVLTVPDVDDADGEDAERMLTAITALLDDIARDNPVFLLRLLPKHIRRPTGGRLPRSEAMLRRLYRGDFIPKEKKEPIIDLGWSEGAYMASIDDDSLVVLDAGSQIASVGLGFCGPSMTASSATPSSRTPTSRPSAPIAARSTTTAACSRSMRGRPSSTSASRRAAPRPTRRPSTSAGSTGPAVVA